MVINCEVFIWLMTLRVSERRVIWRKLATKQWVLVWNDTTHSFELIPVS